MLGAGASGGLRIVGNNPSLPRRRKPRLCCKLDQSVTGLMTTVAPARAGAQTCIAVSGFHRGRKSHLRLDPRLRGGDERVIQDARLALANATELRMQPAVYLLASAPNGTLYVGVTGDLITRVWQHRNGFVEGFTKTVRRAPPRVLRASFRHAFCDHARKAGQEVEPCLEAEIDRGWQSGLGRPVGKHRLSRFWPPAFAHVVQVQRWMA